VQEKLSRPRGNIISFQFLCSAPDYGSRSLRLGLAFQPSRLIPRFKVGRYVYQPPFSPPNPSLFRLPPVTAARSDRENSFMLWPFYTVFARYPCAVCTRRYELMSLVTSSKSYPYALKASCGVLPLFCSMNCANCWLVWHRLVMSADGSPCIICLSIDILALSSVCCGWCWNCCMNPI